MTDDAPAHFVLNLLGGFSLAYADGTPVYLKTRKAELLLAYLALSADRLHPRDTLATMLWAERGEAQARGSLRTSLAELRGVLRDGLIADRDTAHLASGTVDCDVDLLAKAAHASELFEVHMLEELLHGCQPPSEEYAEWLAFERSRCGGLAIAALRRAIDSREGQGDPGGAIELARRLVAFDPLREQNQRLLIRLLSESGERSLAAAQYQSLRKLLRRELDVEPSLETAELVRSLFNAAAPPLAGGIERGPLPEDAGADIAAKAGNNEQPEARPRQSEAKPVVAVLPFDDLDGDTSQRYFSDGISQDIADRLSRYRILSVVGYHSASLLRQRALRMPELRDALGIDYAVTGNIRRGDGRLLVSARLIDARGETAVWAQQYDRPLADILVVQDEVSNLIANTLVGQLESEYGTRHSFSEPYELTSYELVLQGIWHFRPLTFPGVALAADCFKRAIEANPANAEAHKWLSSCHLNDWMSNFGKGKLAAGITLARKAVALDPANAKCHSALSFLLVYAAGTKIAMPVLERAYKLNPGDPDVLCEMGLFKAYSGDLLSSHAFHQQALKLNPFPPAWYADMHGVTHFAEGRYAEALPGFAALEMYGWDTMYALACHGHLGHRDEALALRSHLKAMHGELDLRVGAASEPFASAEPLHRLQAGLALAYAFV